MANESPPSQTPDAKTPEPKLASGALKLLLLVAVLIALLLLVHLTPLKSILTHWNEVSDYLRGMGWAAPVVCVLATALLVAVGVPRLLLCPIGGLAFGFAWGLLWTQLGTLIGYYAVFLFVRWGGRDFAVRKWPALQRYVRHVDKSGWLVVVLARQMPVSGLFVNIMLALTPVSHSAFFVGSAIGILPEAIPATLVGASVQQMSLGRGIGYALLAVACMIAVALVVKWYHRSSRGPQAEATPGSDSNAVEGGNVSSKP